MNYTDFKALVHEASTDRRKVVIHFTNKVQLHLAGKLQSKEKVTVYFFQVLNDDNQIVDYGYKARSSGTKGYNIKSFPYDFIKSVEYPNSTENRKERREQFKKYILMNIQPGVWPELKDSIDSILDSTHDSAYTKVYLKSYANSFEMEQIERYFNEQISGTIHLWGHENVYVETSKRETGFYAWLVINERSWTMINPNVAVLGRR